MSVNKDSYTFFVPHEESALKRAEKEALKQGKAQDYKLYLARPAILSIDEAGDVKHEVVPEIRTRYLIAESEKEDHLILLESHQLLKMSERVGEKTYFIDLYFQPLFGGLQPKELLFVRMEEETEIPRACVLFSVVNKNLKERFYG